MINVLIVDDDAMVAELNRRYVAQLSGFHCCGTASTLEKAKEIIFHSGHHIDLILLDIYMQKENGLDLLPILHSEGCKCDVIVNRNGENLLYHFLDGILRNWITLYGCIHIHCRSGVQPHHRGN